jgi:hypothetical protein
MEIWSKALTIAAGVVAAVVVYVLVDGAARWIFAIHDAAVLESVKLVSANLGALGAAGVVSLWPSNRRAPLFESLATWVVSTCVLIVLAAPSAPPVRDMAQAGQALPPMAVSSIQADKRP